MAEVVLKVTPVMDRHSDLVHVCSTKLAAAASLLLESEDIQVEVARRERIIQFIRMSPGRVRFLGLTTVCANVTSVEDVPLPKLELMARVSVSCIAHCFRATDKLTHPNTWVRVHGVPETGFAERSAKKTIANGVVEVFQGLSDFTLTPEEAIALLEELYRVEIP